MFNESSPVSGPMPRSFTRPPTGRALPPPPLRPFRGGLRPTERAAPFGAWDLFPVLHTGLHIDGVASRSAGQGTKLRKASAEKEALGPLVESKK